MTDTAPSPEWNQTERAYPDDLLHEAFAAQAARTPTAPALRFRDEALTYAELDERIGRLAGRLITLGVAPGSLVAVCMDRSVEMVVALHAILKAGCAYVPIDPEYPDERIAFMLDDLDEPILLTQQRAADRFTGTAAKVVPIDGPSDPVTGPTAADPPSVSPDDLAYVIYTSGSTGRPKGAMITHRAIANRIYWMQEQYGLTAADKVLQKTPFSFDVSVWEFFWPLLFGAELVVAEPGGHRDTTYLAQTIIGCGITTIHFVPSMLELFLEDPKAGDCVSLQRVICSGEALPKALQDRFLARLDTELHNLYGPTEAAVDVSAWACDPDSRLTFVPIGKPIANTQLHILDEDMQPVPVGTAGELHIGGIQVGLGYLDRAELTAERFVVDPFRSGGTLYKTGDLARYLPDGNIEFLGRSDFQVKIRGNRVELGEIEAALESFDGVRGAVVVAHERAGRDLELVAYVMHDDAEAAPIEDLRTRLAAQLPEFMVPSTFMGVGQFTLTSNGKIDRNSLPAPVRLWPDLGAHYVAPRSELERLIALAWRRILDLERVGIHDRFFELGGTSLQAARFVNQMQAELDEPIFVVSLFSAPSVAEYAAFLERQYPTAVVRLLGAEPSIVGTSSASRVVSEADLGRLRSVVPVLGEAAVDTSQPNPSAIFILSPPRSGTTLLRIMLAGHHDLLAASELQLLGFSTMRERAAAYSGRYSNWLDGAVRVVMEVLGLGADEAKATIASAEADGLTTKAFFGQLQAAVAPRILVDKSPSYALDPVSLRKAERDFDGPRYIHLIRDPGAMIASFERHHMEQVLYLNEHSFDSRQLAELVWTLSHRNITEFLADVSPSRWHRLRYEDLVRDPAAQMEALCDAVGLRFDEAVVRPYEGLEHKMIDGVHAESAPMGDPGFLALGRIDPSRATVVPHADTSALGTPTLALAKQLGYASMSDGPRDGPDRGASPAQQRHSGTPRETGRGTRPVTGPQSREQVAIVGMAGRFPGAADVDRFWANLCQGVESIRSFSEEELRDANADASEPGFVNAGSVMDGFGTFDAAFFGMTRREAELTDPQHRVFLESAWAAIENAGYDPGSYHGRVGVFGGVAANTYYQNNLMAHPSLLARTGDYPLLLATEREYAITRTAYKLDLDGPAMSVNTACSTSAVAVHLAVRSLLSGESDLALAGGARIKIPATVGYVYQEDGILSPDGHCRTFDANARGTVRASGVAIVALKRLSDAIHDGDAVYAVIKGSAVNNDGGAKVGITAPSVDGQAAVIEEALAVAGVDAGSIGMLEAHGTATSLGDPIEVAALTKVFRNHTDRRQFCAIGSLKSNIGHLDAGAGVAGIIKAALSLHHGYIPPTISFKSPNPQIDFDSSPFFVNTRLRKWERTSQPRRAGVSSFGLGGTNAHVVLEEAPLQAPATSSPAREAQVLTLSARTASALERRALELADHLGAGEDVNLPDVAYTLATGRARMLHRRAVVASAPEEAVRLLRGLEERAIIERQTEEVDVEIAFLFSGQGVQHPGMGAGLYRSEPAFREALDECAAILHPILGKDLLALIYPEGVDPDSAARALDQAAVAQPATFAVQYALARLWMDWGVQPAALVGHSLGEFAAACLGGVFSLQDALRLVATRGRLMQALGGGAMLAAASEPEALAPMLDEQTSIAAVNAPGQAVASGPTASIDALESRLVEAGVRVKRLPIGLAAHSPMMEPMVDPLREAVRDAKGGRLQIPMVSSVTGDWVDDSTLADPDYWGVHARATVRFADAVGRLLERPGLALLEVGPGQALASLAQEHPAATPDRVVLASLPHPGAQIDDERFAQGAVGELWAAGADIDWTAVHGGQRRRVALPTYPFERERFWIDGRGSVDVQPVHDAPVGPLPAPVATVATDGAPDPPPAPNGTSRPDRIAAELTSILSDLSGVEPSELDASADFVDLGFDSLFLTQANSQLRKRFGVRITFRQLFEEAPTIDALAKYIDSELAPDVHPGQQASAASPADAVLSHADRMRVPGGAGGSGAGTASRLEQLIREQSRLMDETLELLRSGSADTNGTGSLADGPDAGRSSTQTPGSSASTSKVHYLATRDQSSRAVAESHALSDRQQVAIDELVRRTSARTGTSKRRAQLWRPRLADNRTIVGFDKAWKELVYQVVSDRSAGSRIWDVDGNEYIDTALGYGTNLFGHAPAFVVDAVREQLERGYEVGAQNHLLGEVTEAACRLTGNERLAYTTSGGEAVETAIRVARTVTGRDKVAYFTDDIHGRSDIVLGRALELHGELRTVPLVAGVPQGVIDDAFVLAYGDDRALEVIGAQASELALVLVEPVRTRNPDLQPVEFLRQLRRMADEHGFLLVFDEIVTGFRAHPGGVQAMIGVNADLTTYGKVLGGGLPIGVVTGASEYVDVIDGGPWSFGDDSFPEADITASGGTFIKHPLTLAASRAVLTHLDEQGPSLQADLNERTAAAVDAINTAYQRDGLPIHIEHFSSFFRPKFIGSARFAGLFQYYLRERGVHTNPPSPSFLSTAHSEADIEAVVEAYIETGRAMDHDGLFERPAAPAAAGAEAIEEGEADTPVPVLPNVARFLVERETPEPDHWNLGVLLRPERPLDANLVREATERLVERHDALRLRFYQGADGWASSITPLSEPVPVSHYDLTDLPEEARRPGLERHAGEMQRSLDLKRGPVFRMALFDLGADEQRLLMIIHHFAMDGLSWRPFWDDFETIYHDLRGSEPVALPPQSTSFEEWARALGRRADSDQLNGTLREWLDLPWDRVHPIPFDRVGGDGDNTNASARQVTLDFSVDETSQMLHETPGVVHKTDLLMTTLAHVLAGWTGSDTAMFDLMGHGRDEENVDGVDLFGSVGFFISYTPMVLSVRDDETPAVAVVASDQIRPILARGLSFDLLRYMTDDASVRQTLAALPRAQVLFNHLGKRVERDAVPRGSMFSPAAESIGLTHSPSGLRYYPLAISSEIWKDQLQLKFVYSENLHERATVEDVASDFKRKLMDRVGRTRRGREADSQAS